MKLRLLRKKKTGNGEIRLKFVNNNQFLSINPDEFNKNLQNLFIPSNNKEEKPNLNKICDGIILYKNNDEYNLILVELKKTLNYDNYLIVKKQLEASYIKIMMVLNIIYDITKINIFCIIAHDTKNESENKMLANKAQNILKNDIKDGEYKEFLDNKNIKLKKIPFFFDILINQVFIKENIEIRNIRFNQCFDIY